MAGFRTSPGKIILITVLLAGTLDLLAACTQFYFVRHTNPFPVVLKYIASGVFGQEAMKGGAGMMLAGLLFHYLIVLGCVVAFFALYPRVRIMRINKFATALVYGLLVWVMTNLVIVPLSLVKRGPFQLSNVLIAMAILVVMIGLPISWLIGNYFDRKKDRASTARS